MSVLMAMLIHYVYAHRSQQAFHQGNKFIVFEECLLGLFRNCRRCGVKEGIQTKTSIIGTFITITQHCSTCLFQFRWESQPIIKNIPAGNILLSGSILFSGSLPSKVMKMFRIFGCASISESTYFNHQKTFLQPSINSVWKHKQETLFKQLRKEKRPLIIGGDGRADSPGHSAKFGSYTVMELKNKKVIDIELVQVNKCTPMTLSIT